MLIESGWIIQNKKTLNLNANEGIPIREYQTDIGPADYVLFIDKKPIGIIEAKREEEGVRLTSVEEQSSQYANAKLRLNSDSLPFVYKSTGEITRFTDYRDPKPRSRNVFSFHDRPETFAQCLKDSKTHRSRLHDIPTLQFTSIPNYQSPTLE
jgi:type I restriction enzyme R subunit